MSLWLALRVKDIEKTTNHDVKAVEYLLKEKVCFGFSNIFTHARRCGHASPDGCRLLLTRNFQKFPSSSILHVR